MAPIIGTLIDLAPAWIWRPANLRFIGEHRVHFCFDGEGRRTVEIDERVVCRGTAKRDRLSE